MKVYKIVRIPGRTSVYAIGKYQLKYPVGSIVTALKGTLGIMCFSTREYALKFVTRRGLLDGIIIEVEGLGKPLRPRRIAWLNLESQFDKFYEVRRQCKEYYPPTKPAEGTICFQKVKVLS